MKNVVWHRLVSLVVVPCLLCVLGGCPEWLGNSAAVKSHLDGYWMSIEMAQDPAGEEGNEETTRVDPDFWHFRQVDETDGMVTYEVTHACAPEQLVAQAYQYLDEGRVEIEQVSTGVSLWATVSDGPELHAMTPVDGGTWTAWRIEKPTCGEVDAEGNIPVVQQVIELVDDEPEVYPSGQSAQANARTAPNGLAHLDQARGSRLTMGEESSKTVGGESKDCSSNGSPVDCGASGGHPGYVQCVDQEMSESKIQELANVVTLGDTDQVYPGALLQGQHFDGGSFTPVTLPRSGGSLTMNGLYGTKANFTRQVNEINYANVTDAITAILSENHIEGTAANASYRVDTAYSSTQWGFKVGSDVKVMSVDISASVDAGSQKETNTVIMKFTQVFYTVSFQDPARRTDVFADGEAFDDPENQIGTGNPPLYVSNVKYGRQVLFVARSSLGSSYVTAALNGAYNGASATVKVDSSMTYKDVMKNTSITYIVRGGDAGLALEPLKNASPDEMYDKIKEFLANRNAATWSPQNPGIPVAYTLRYLYDRTVAMKGMSTTYNRRDCKTIAAEAYRFRLEVDNIDDDVYVWLDSETDATRKAMTNDSQLRGDVNSWLPADGRDHTIIVRLGNGGGLGTSGDFRFYSGGSPVWQYSYHPWGWQDFGWQVYVTFVVNPDTGKCQVKDFWHAH